MKISEAEPQNSTKDISTNPVIEPQKKIKTNPLLILLSIMLFLTLTALVVVIVLPSKENTSSETPTLTPTKIATAKEVIKNRKIINNNELKGIINSENNCGADLKLNGEGPNEFAHFSRNGITFEIPYNHAWGNEKYILKPYDNYVGKFDASDDIFFGNIVLYEGCSIKRDYQLSFNVPMTKVNFVKFVGQAAVEMCDLKETMINGLEVVEYKEFCGSKNPENHIVFLGTKNNYDFRSKNDMTQIVKTVKIQDPDQPDVIQPESNTTVKSPLVVKGSVPPEWMFEGQFPIKLTDANKKVIVTGSAKEVTPGSWQKNDPIEFSATLTFSTTEKSGFLILENDNPSGDPAKAKSFEVPINF